MTLKRSGFVPRKQQAFKRSERKESDAVAKVRRGMKSSRPKMTPIRASAKGEQCTLRFPCCTFKPEQTVWCHSNNYVDGKGAGLKARDEEGCYGCAACHAFLDGGYAGHMKRELVDIYFDIARALSQAILQHKGLMKGATGSDSQSPPVADQKNTIGELY